MATSNTISAFSEWLSALPVPLALSHSQREVRNRVWAAMLYPSIGLLFYQNIYRTVHAVTIGGFHIMQYRGSE